MIFAIRYKAVVSVEEVHVISKDKGVRRVESKHIINIVDNEDNMILFECAKDDFVSFHREGNPDK